MAHTSATVSRAAAILGMRLPIWSAPAVADGWKLDERSNCFSLWLPNQRVAKAWADYVTTGAVSDTTPPPWGNDTVSYPRYVRPVLDAYCSKCHQGDGEGRKTLDLTERRSRLHESAEEAIRGVFAETEINIHVEPAEDFRAEHPDLA